MIASHLTLGHLARLTAVSRDVSRSFTPFLNERLGKYDSGYALGPLVKLFRYAVSDFGNDLLETDAELIIKRYLLRHDGTMSDE